MSKTLPRTSLLYNRISVWTEATAVRASVIPSGECRFAYGDTQPSPALEGSIAYNQDSIENPNNSKLWLMPTIENITYIVHEF